MKSIKDLTDEREKSHGDYEVDATIAMDLVDAIANHGSHLPPYMRHTLHMLMVKIGRICAGNPMELDHWTDMMGYIDLTRGLISKHEAEGHKE